MVKRVDKRLQIVYYEGIKVMEVDMTSKVIKTSKVVDSLGTRYYLDVLTDNGISTKRDSIGTYTDAEQVRNKAFDIYAFCVNEIGIDNVHVSEVTI